MLPMLYTRQFVGHCQGAKKVLFAKDDRRLQCLDFLKERWREEGRKMPEFEYVESLDFLREGYQEEGWKMPEDQFIKRDHLDEQAA
jgi:hypothetical protein